jgi:hypothetical protein
MRKEEEGMVVDVEHIKVDKQPLSTAEAESDDMYGNDPYKESQQY